MVGAAGFPRKWAGITGDWELSDRYAKYVGSEGPSPHGILIGGSRIGGGVLSRGTVKTSIKLSQDAVAGHILLGYYSLDSRYVTVGLGGNNVAYAISEFAPGMDWTQAEGVGKRSYLEAGRPYDVEVRLDGQRLRLSVDGVRVLTHILRQPLARGQVGIFATGDGAVEFGSVEISTQAPSAFVIMQFTDQFNALYEDVIQPVCADLGIEAYRASDIYRPGVIIQDITQGLAESHAVIAEITPPNPNVFYELGYSHALQKPAILLADRETTDLPFDISGYRVIFYDNTIRGKSSLEADLRQHLGNILT